MSGGQINAEKFGDWFTYERNPRALIFQRDQSKVKDVAGMINLMRFVFLLLLMWLLSLSCL